MADRVKSDPKILECQKALGTYYTGKLDGIFGDLTRKAILAIVADVAKLKAQIVTLTAERDKLKNDYAACTAVLNETKAELATVKGVLLQTQDENGRLKNDLGSVTAQNIGLKASINDLTAEIIELKKTKSVVEVIEAMKEGIEELKDLLRALIDDSLAHSVSALQSLDIKLKMLDDKLKDAAGDATS